MIEITAAHMCCECGYISETGAVTASTGFHWCVCVCVITVHMINITLLTPEHTHEFCNAITTLCP